MLEVHAARQAMHTWKDFLIHIATIVVGLIIAVGLEQAVEALHHRYERSELRQTLRHESEQILKDSRRTDAALAYHRSWLARRVDQVKAAVWQRQPLAEPTAYALPIFDYPDSPLWRSAKLSGLVERLSTDELNAYSEVELLIAKIDVFYTAWRGAQSKRRQFERQYPQRPGGEMDFSNASAADLRTYLGLLTDEDEATSVFREWDQNVEGAEETIFVGDLRLEAIFAAERKATNQR
jgi:hypothetical protein